VIGDHADLTAWHWSDHVTTAHNTRALTGRIISSLVLLAALPRVAAAQSALQPRPIETKPPEEAKDEPLVRKRDAKLSHIFRGPFQSSRLFTMPTADSVGAYVLSISGEGSLLQETGVLTSAGVAAIGFGDIAQLEYRHTAAISVTGISAPLPAVGVQLRLPLPRRSAVPAIGVAFRLGVPRREKFGATFVDEKVTDLYLVTRFRVDSMPWLTLHGGLRYSPATITLSGDRDKTIEKSLWLPAGGVELGMNREAKLVAEVALAPRFVWLAAEPDTDPTIGQGVLTRLGLRWAVLPSVIIDGSVGYQNELGRTAEAERLDAVVAWDIRLGAEVFVPWGALACRAAGVFCD
jgi:hypothetical protein